MSLISPAPITVVIADDDEMIRDLLCLLLQRIQGVSIVGQAGDGHHAGAIIAELQPQIAIIDIHLPRRSGIDVAAEIHRKCPAIGLILLTGYPDYQLVVRSFKAGAKAFVFKGRPAEEIEFALKAVVDGLAFISPAIADELLANYLCGRSVAASDTHHLTNRERQVLHMVAEGATNKDIAGMLGLSVRTAERHRYLLMKRLGVHSTAELVLFAVRTGLIDPSRSAAIAKRNHRFSFPAEASASRPSVRRLQ